MASAIASQHLSAEGFRSGRAEDETPALPGLMAGLQCIGSIGLFEGLGFGALLTVGPLSGLVAPAMSDRGFHQWVNLRS